MSFPYHQYVDYSNPATPSVYGWEVASATSTPDQDPAHQLPAQQDSQQPAQHHHSQQQQISPSQLQLQQLPPPLPLMQHQQPSPSQEQLQQLQQSHQQGQSSHAATPQNQTIQVVPPSVQPQYRFETVTEEDFIHAHATGERPGASRRRGASKPPSLHVDTSRASTSSAGAVASTSMLSSAGPGPSRVPHSRAHVHSAHPYRRPQSRAASGSASSAVAGVAQAPVRTRRLSELQYQTLQTSVGGAPASTSSTALPTVGTAMAVSCPASNAWREGLLGLSNASFDPDVTPTTGTIPPRRYGIRADVHYSSEENIMTAMFELPGVQRSDLRITMSVCPFSRVRQVSISGISRVVLPLQGHSVRERKFGEFFRTLAIPSETKPEDIAVSLVDGILTLRISCGAPSQVEQPHDIPIP